MRKPSKKYKLDPLKEWFLDDCKNGKYDESTIRTINYTLNRARTFEIEYMNEKTIENFNYDEIILFFKFLGSGSFYSLDIHLKTIYRFLDFARKESNMDNVIDYLRTINIENLKSCVNKNKLNNKFISSKELYPIVEKKLKNNFDKALVLLPFEGILGKEYSELINLKKSDIDFENNIINVNDSKQIIMNDKLRMILKEFVNDEYCYKERDGEILKEKFIDSKYLFRYTEGSLKSKSDIKEKLNKSYIRTYVSREVLKKKLNLNYLTIYNTYRSGIVERAVKYCKENSYYKNNIVDYREFLNFVCSNYNYHNSVAHKLYIVYQELNDKFD